MTVPNTRSRNRNHPRTQTERNRAALPVIVYGATAILLFVPGASVVGEWQHLLRYGWPGPYDAVIAEPNAGETLFTVQLWAIASAIVLVAGAVTAGVAARSARQRVWLVTLVGVVSTVLLVLVVGFLLTPPLASSSN